MFTIKIFRSTQVQVAAMTAVWFFGVSMLAVG